MGFAAGLTPELLRLAAWTLVFGLLLLSRDLPWRAALPVALLKVALPVAYFGLNPAGSLHLSDDVQYFNNAVTLLKMGFGPLSIFTDPRGLPTLMALSGTGRHVVYPLWNLLGLSVFGPFYHVPVLLNVGLTFVSGWFFHRILRDAGFGVNYCRAGLVFFLLHWETIAWSSFMNLKDTLVITLVLAAVQQLLALQRRPGLLRVVPVVLVLTALMFLRFYAPVMILAAWLLSLALGRYGLRAAVSLGAVLLGISAWFSSTLGRDAGRLHPAQIGEGVVQFLLTPLPWNLNPGYEFLLIPATLHLVLLVPALLAAPSLWKRSGQARFLLLYLAIVVASFAIVPENRGIRQRQMASFVFAWMQFHALWAFARYALAAKPRSTGLKASRPNGDAAASSEPGKK